MKRPSFQFYPSDWLRDTALRSCSTGARGLWMDMICFMHEGKPYGHLKVGDKVILPSNLARMVGDNSDLVADWLLELSQAGVYETTEDGVIFSKRMVRDENLRQIRAAGGFKGGNPALINKDKVNLEVIQEVKQKSTPSSSSSSSSSKDKKATVVACPDGVEEEVWQDWLQLRKAKKAPVTQTVVNSAIKEAEKAGISLNAFLTIWCARGSQGLQAEWLKTNERQPFVNKYDVAHITTPPPPNQDAALRKIEEDGKRAVKPSLEVLAKMAELRKKVQA
jgi:hypothetical protein